MINFVKTMTLILSLVFASLCWAGTGTLPTAPLPQSDGTGFHRTNDFLFGAVISGAVGAPTRPWIGLIAGCGAGVANEARYGSNFNTGHLGVICSGAVASYVLLKVLTHKQKRTKN